MKISPNKSFFWSVIIAITALILFSALSSCVTEKQRQKILKTCPVASTENIKDSTWTKIEIQHDTTYISISGPTQYLPSPCATLCDSLGNLKPFKIESKKNGIKQSLESQGNTLVQKCDVDSLLRVNEEKTIQINRLIQKEKETQVHENCKLDHISKMDSFFIISGRILILIILIYVVFRIVKMYLKF